MSLHTRGKFLYFIVAALNFSKYYMFSSLKFVILQTRFLYDNAGIIFPETFKRKDILPNLIPAQKQGVSLLNKGIYCLIIKLHQGRNIKVGRLGSFPFISGFYVYVGSAQNNLKQRIARHLRKEKKAHWHIDYLLQHGKVVGIRKHPGKKQEECALSRKLEKIRGAATPVKGFGSSDCSCISHLHFFPNDPVPIISKICLAEQ